MKNAPPAARLIIPLMARMVEMGTVAKANINESKLPYKDDYDTTEITGKEIRVG